MRKIVYSVYKYGACFDYIFTSDSEQEAQAKLEQLGASNHGIDERCITSQDIIDTIYDNLQRGLSYSNGFSGVVLRRGYLCYNHYGSSAQENTKEGLRFILEHIFNDVVDFESVYKLGHDLVY